MNGTVCVVGGSRLYHGAPFLCAMGAMRSGVDLVYVAVPASIATAVRSLSPDFIVVPLPDSKLTRGNVSKLMSWVPDVDTFAVGPGLGAQKPESVAQALNQMKGGGRSLVVDADALRSQVLPSIRRTKAVVTPHAGEFERLFGERLPDDTEGRVRLVATEAKKAGLTVLLKGPTDIISDGEEVAVNETHSPAMTVGGTGDVLTGVTAGLLAKKVPPYEAACAAAYVNGAAGVEAAKEFGMHITPSDVASKVAGVMKRFDRIS
ncbi:MAG: NAD(P)H-hydrate dehydratase [Nitrososphaerota archaeon]|nr:NAD(P)H-hydrate dehydratase [Nitrososphaerota archaeon]MDG7023088.1 NAD(P)H-hydrate dehydratase [Nitrososphaerota archaeon]